MNVAATLPHSAHPPMPVLKLWAIASACLLGAAVFGGVGGASTSVVNGAAEQGQGAYLAEQSPAFWAWQSSRVVVVPNPVPVRASGLVAAPSILPRGSTNYVIDAATAGHTAVRWIFSEGATTPASTELELRFLVGLVNPAVQITVYVETQAVIPGGAPVYRFYWDAGTPAPGTITVDTLQVVVLACTAVGNCP